MVNLKAKSIWKRYAFCGGMQIYGTLCSIDEVTQVVSCTCSNTLTKGYDWTLIYYLMMKVDYGKVHLIDRTNKDKKLSQEQVWHVLALEFNSEMKFVKEDDIKNGKQLKDFLGTVQGEYISITFHEILMYTLLSHNNDSSFCRHCEEELFS